MKKFLALLLVFILVFSLAACNKPEEEAKDDTQKTEKVETEKDKETTEEKTEAEAGKESEKFFKMFAGGKYHMKARMDIDGSGLAEMEIYVDGDKTATEMDMMGMKIRGITRDGKVYSIMDDAKMIMVGDAEEGDQASGPETEGMAFDKAGKDDFCGRNLPYEEYKNDEGIKVQYFLDGDKLAGVRTISDEVGVIDIEVLEIDQNVPANVFEVPSDYEVLDMGEMIAY